MDLSNSNGKDKEAEAFKLKECLKSGQFDEELEKYINEIYSQISLRSQIIELVKNYLENTGFQRASIDSLRGAWSAKSSNENKA